MTLHEAVNELTNGEFWKYVDTMPKDVLQKMLNAIDVALVCACAFEDTSNTLAHMEKLDKEHEAKERPRQLVEGDESCADCLCRVCARNEKNDATNSALEGGYADCIPCECCKIGAELVVLPEDCPKGAYLPDESDV